MPGRGTSLCKGHQIRGRTAHSWIVRRVGCWRSRVEAFGAGAEGKEGVWGFREENHLSSTLLRKRRCNKRPTKKRKPDLCEHVCLTHTWEVLSKRCVAQGGGLEPQLAWHLQQRTTHVGRQDRVKGSSVRLRGQQTLGR